MYNRQLDMLSCDVIDKANLEGLTWKSSMHLVVEILARIRLYW